jgi:hypothetical protein
MERVLANISLRSSSKLLFRLSDISLKLIIALLIFVIILFSIAYYSLAFSNNGLVFSHETSAQVSFWNCVYFSIVTISSLGYGDMRPQGLSKILSCLEVLMGLGFLGLMVAKIASLKQDYQLRRVYGFMTKQCLDAFYESLNICHQGYKELLDEASSVTSNYQNGLKPPGKRKQLKDLNNRLQTVCRAIRNHLVYETKKIDYFSEIAASSIIRLLKPISSILNLWGQMPKEYRPAFVERSRKKKLYHTLTFFDDICDIIERNTSNEEIKNPCRGIREQVSLVRQIFDDSLP